MAATEGSVASKGLKAGAIGLVGTIVIGVASTAPGYSLAASLGLVTDEVGLQSPAIMWIAFVPMGCIAAAYFYLNRADADCGTTFTWVTRAIGPRSGWIAGWGIILADLVIMPNLAGISGSYLFLLFGAEGLAANAVWVTVLGIAFILSMSLICVIGIELNVKTQIVLLGIELLVLVVFAIVSLWKVYVDAPPGSVKPSLSWLNPLEIGSGSALAAGLVVAVFIYWGWDTAVSVNEETDDAKRTPGLAAVFSTLILLAIYVIVTVGAQAFRGPDFLTENSDDTLSAVGNAVLGGFFNKVLIIAVLTSAAASCQTTILPAARSMLSMGVHKAGPPRLAAIDRRHLTPAFSTWLFGIIACVWYVLLVVVSENTSTDAYGSAIAAVGIMIAFYYGLTGYACVIYYRKYLFRSVKDLFLVGVLPLFGALTLSWIFFKTLLDSFKEDYGYGTIFGIGTVFVIGVSLLLLGIPLMLWWNTRERRFFDIATDPLDRRPAPDGTGPTPPRLGTITKEPSRA